MLDTDTVRYALRGDATVVANIREHRPSELCISAITLSELRFGADLHKSTKIHRAIDAFVGDVQPMPFDDVAAAHYGTIAATLREQGSPIGNFDVLIAAHALALGVMLVTNNVKHFTRVRGLKVANWS